MNKSQVYCLSTVNVKVLVHVASQKAKHFISLGNSTVDLSAPFKISCDNYPKIFLRVGPLDLLMVEGVVIHGWVTFSGHR